MRILTKENHLSMMSCLRFGIVFVFLDNHEEAPVMTGESRAETSNQ